MIKFVIQGIPPSLNNAYTNLPRGGRAPTAALKKYKNETKTFLSRTYMKELKEFVTNSPYLVYMRFFVQDFLNSTYGKKGGAESRYKRADVSNRAKIVEDVIKDVTGVDDSSTMTLILEKRPTTAGYPAERTEVFIWNLDREESPFDGHLLTL